MKKLQKNMLKYSVVIPTHNRNDFLLNALNSVLNQTYKPFEIIVVDDLSNFETKKCVDEIAEKHKFDINYVTSTSTNGVSHSYNLGSSYSKGDFLSFLDDDDYWDTRYLEKVSEIINKKKVEIVLTVLTQFNEENEFKLFKVPPDDYNVDDFYLVNPGVLRSNVVIKKEKFDLVHGYDESIFGSSDKEIFMRLKKTGCQHYVIKELVVFKRRIFPCLSYIN